MKRILIYGAMVGIWLMSAMLYGAWKKRVGLELGVMTCKAERVIFAQQRFLHDKKALLAGMDYIEAVVDLASDHADAARRNVSKAIFSEALQMHLDALKHVYGQYKVTSKTQELLVLGLEDKGLYRVIKTRNMSLIVNVGAAGDHTIAMIVAEVQRLLPEKMRGGAISE